MSFCNCYFSDIFSIKFSLSCPWSWRVVRCSRKFIGSFTYIRTGTKEDPQRSEFFDTVVASSIHEIVWKAKRKVAAGRSHGGCGSAPRNYGSCHGCSFVDGVFAPWGGCPNHEPRKLHPPSPSLTTSPSHPPAKPGELPLLFPPSSTFQLRNHPVLLYLLPFDSPYLFRRRLTSLIPLRSYWRPAHSSRDDLSKIGNLTIVDRHPSSHGVDNRTNFVLNLKTNTFVCQRCKKYLSHLLGTELHVFSAIILFLR